VVARFTVVLLVACSSNKPRTADDATHVARGDAPAIDAIAIDAPPAAPISTAKTGDLQIRVEWRDVPIPMRASPGRTTCNTPRLPAVAPTTTWGIPDVLIIVEGAAIPPSATHVVLADCVLTPRLVAASSLVVESAVDRPASLTFAKRGELASITKLDTGKPIPIQLPIAGHTVTLPLEANGIYELVASPAGQPRAESAWIVAASGNAGVTEPNGALLVKDLAPGTYPVSAWLPPRAGAPAKLAKGSATIVAGDVADLTLELK